MSDNRLSNLCKDLTKAKQQALLIEVLQGDLDSWIDQSPDVFRVVCDASAAIYDVGANVGKTNVLVVGEAESREPLSIFGNLLGGLDNEFDDLHKREILKKLTSFGLNQALGGVVGEALGASLSVGAGQMMEYLAEWNGSAPDSLASAVEAGVESVADESSEIVGNIGGTGAEAIAGQFSSEDSVYLTRAARKRLKEIAPRLSDKATSHETLQLALEMLLVTAQGAPKVIVVKDPLRLDDASLTLLAMLVSLEKDLRQVQVNYAADPEARVTQTVGVSVVLAFTGLQPIDTVDNQRIAEKKQVISRLRMMASRYSLLERLDSDIPLPAVRASTFVGRKKELGELRQHWNSFCAQPDSAARQTWCLIKGEPGTGKTALANRFIHQIRSDIGYPSNMSIPTLRMLNQTGHSAQATGLASLKNSVADELRRLALIYQEDVGLVARLSQQVKEGIKRLKDDAISDDPEAKRRTQGRVGRVVSKLMGLDAAVGIAGSVKDWSNQQEMRSMREQEFVQSSQANYKEEQFELLQEALREIRRLALKCQSGWKDPTCKLMQHLILLVDDLQWIDDVTAEFLLNEWPADVPVYIIATARGSDSFAITGYSGPCHPMNQYRNRLFAEFGLIDAGLDALARESHEEKEVDLLDKMSLARSLELTGMDQFMLAELIQHTYLGVTVEQSERFAAGVIRNLSGKASDSEVVTLFAIETLNVLSDPMMYRRNPSVPRLIEQLPNSDRYCFAATENLELIEALSKVFKKLRDTYHASYLMETEQTSAGTRFNLASYAVLEERLHLIEHYFEENGGSARYSLLFSALLGSPFQSSLIEHILEELKGLLPEECPGLEPFITVLNSEVMGSFKPAHYELLERAFEVIRRLEEVSPKYVHQHSLLKEFLLGQLSQLINRIFPEPDDLESGLRMLVIVTEAAGNDWFARREVLGSQGWLSQEAAKVERLRFLIALNGFWYRFMKARQPESELGEWAERYAGWLNILAVTLNKQGRPDEALPLSIEATAIRGEGYDVSPLRWLEDYANSLSNQAMTLDTLGKTESALVLHEYALSIIEKGSNAASDSWKKDQARLRSGYACNLFELGRYEDALTLIDEALSVQREGYKSSEDRWRKAYFSSLNIKACVLIRLSRAADAEEILEEAREDLFEAYKSSEEHWAEDYVALLNNLINALHELGREQDAYGFLEEAYSICRDRYANSKEQWIELYLSVLNSKAFNGAISYDDRLDLLQETTSILRDAYKVAPERWARKYVSSLNSLSSTQNQLIEKLESTKEAVFVQRLHFESSPEYWFEDYVSNLKSIAHLMIDLSGFSESVLLYFRESKSVFRKVYEADRLSWIDRYVDHLNEVAYVLYQINCSKGEVDVWLNEAYEAMRECYEYSPDTWVECYVYLLTKQSDLLPLFNCYDDALVLMEEALSILRNEYSLFPNRWRKDLVRNLIKIIYLIREMERFSEDTLQLVEEARSILRAGFGVSPDKYAEEYVKSLFSIVECLPSPEHSEEAISLLEEALSITRKWDAMLPDDYVRNLKRIGFSMGRFGHSEQGRRLFEEARSIALKRS